MNFKNEISNTSVSHFPRNLIVVRVIAGETGKSISFSKGLLMGLTAFCPSPNLSLLPRTVSGAGFKPC
jgi:hypothetical protein